MDMKEAVSNGVELLNRRIPGWWREDMINVEKIDLHSYKNCILGQLFKDCRLGLGFDSHFGFGARFLFGHLGDPEFSVALRDHGFISEYVYGFTAEDLDKEWTTRILELRENAKARKIHN